MIWCITKMEDELRHYNEKLRADGETDQPIRNMAGTDVRLQRKYRGGSIFKKTTFPPPPRARRDRCGSGTLTSHPAGG